MEKNSQDPFSQIRNLGEIVEDMVKNSVGQWLGNDFVVNFPAVNIIEKVEAFEMEVAAPGMSREDFTLSLENDKLNIHGKAKEIDIPKESFKKREYAYREFDRSFIIPENSDVEGISAKYKKGILRVIIPLKEKNENVSQNIEVS